MNILLVDDDKNLLNNLKKLLQDIYSYNIDISTTCLGAIIQHTENNYDVLIIDFDFGDDMNGIEVATLIRNTDKEIKIIIFSAYDIGILGSQTIQSIGATFLQKPIDHEILNKNIKGI